MDVDGELQENEEEDNEGTNLALWIYSLHVLILPFKYYILELDCFEGNSTQCAESVDNLGVFTSSSNREVFYAPHSP